MKYSYFTLFISIIVLCSNTVCAENLPSNPWETSTVGKFVSDNTNTLHNVHKTAVTATRAVLDSAPANPWTNQSHASGTSFQDVQEQLSDTFETSAQNVKGLVQQVRDIKQNAETIASLQNITDTDSQVPSKNQISTLLSDVSKIMKDQSQTANTNTNTTSGMFNGFNTVRPQQKKAAQPSAISKAANDYKMKTERYKRQMRSKYNSARRTIRSYTNTAQKAIEKIEKSSGIDPKAIQKMMH